MIIEKFLTAIRDQQLVSPGDRVLLAVSGGADSTAMLRLFLEIRAHYHLDLVVAHLNHGLRQEESNEDEEHVRQLAAIFHLEIVAERLSPVDRSFGRSGGMENWAREQRYRFLVQAAESLGAQKIALGHTMNDQAETVLMRLLRGSGTSGLAAIPAVRERRFIRPMLQITRAEVLSYLDSCQIRWREDSSNRDLRYFRNRIRLELIPYLEERYNHSIISGLARTASNLKEEADVLEVYTQADFSREAFISKEKVVWDLTRLREYPPAIQRQLLRHSMKSLLPAEFLIGRRMVDSACVLLQPGKSGKSISQGGLRLSREFQFLAIEVLAKNSPAERGYDVPLEVPGKVRLDRIGSELEAYLGTSLDDHNRINRWVLLLTAEEMASGLRVRNWRFGDCYRPIGFLRVRKAKELFLLRKIPRRLRKIWPVVTLSDKIIFMKDFPVDADMLRREHSETMTQVVIEERNIEP